MKTIAWFAFVLLISTGCSFFDESRTVTVKDRYSLDLPGSLSEASGLNEDASLQYQNIFKELYIIVLDETKDEFEKAIVENSLTEVYSYDLKGYTNLILDNYFATINVSDKSELVSAKINGLDARRISMTGTYDNINAFFSITFLEGKNRYYQIMTWTLAERKQDHLEAMEKMIKSFREIRSN